MPQQVCRCQSAFLFWGAQIPWSGWAPVQATWSVIHQGHLAVSITALRRHASLSLCPGAVDTHVVWKLTFQGGRLLACHCSVSPTHPCDVDLGGQGLGGQVRLCWGHSASVYLGSFWLSGLKRSVPHRGRFPLTLDETCGTVSPWGTLSSVVNYQPRRVTWGKGVCPE